MLTPLRLLRPISMYNESLIVVYSTQVKSKVVPRLAFQLSHGYLCSNGPSHTLTAQHVGAVVRRSPNERVELLK